MAVSNNVDQHDADAVADVAIVGAGLAGLIAARDLGEHGLSVVVLEARDRIGGRTFARPLAGTDHVVDFGGTWIRPAKHAAVVAELQRYNIGTVRTPDPDRFLTELADSVDSTGFLSESQIHDLATAYAFIADHFGDHVALEEALHSVHLDAAVRAWVSASERYLSGAPLSDLSAAAYAKTAAADVGNPDHYTHWIQGTTAALVNAIAGDVGAPIVLNTEVRSVEASTHGFSATDATGRTWRARELIMAVPVNVLAHIAFSPTIEEAHALGSTKHAGHSVKLWLTVSNVEGAPRIFSARGPIAYARFERSLGPNESLFVGFSDDPALAGATAGDVQDVLRRFLPTVDVLSVDCHDWNADPYARGTWMAPRPGQMTQVATLVDPESTSGIHFVGGDVCTEAFGTLEGAVLTGRHAAAQIIASCKAISGSATPSAAGLTS